MEFLDLKLEWSTLIPLVKKGIEELKLDGVGGVYRISKKESDGKFYVVLVGSAKELRAELLKLISENTAFKAFYDIGGDFSFRFAPLQNEEEQKAVEKQLYKQYAPRFNTEEPSSLIDVKVNLN